MTKNSLTEVFKLTMLLHATHLAAARKSAQTEKKTSFIQKIERVQKAIDDLNQELSHGGFPVEIIFSENPLPPFSKDFWPSYEITISRQGSAPLHQARIQHGNTQDQVYITYFNGFSDHMDIGIQERSNLEYLIHSLPEMLSHSIRGTEALAYIKSTNQPPQKTL